MFDMLTWGKKSPVPLSDLPNMGSDACRWMCMRLLGYFHSHHDRKSNYNLSHYVEQRISLWLFRSCLYYVIWVQWPNFHVPVSLSGNYTSHSVCILPPPKLSCGYWWMYQTAQFHLALNWRKTLSGILFQEWLIKRCCSCLVSKILSIL